MSLYLHFMQVALSGHLLVRHASIKMIAISVIHCIVSKSLLFINCLTFHLLTAFDKSAIALQRLLYSQSLQYKVGHLILAQVSIKNLLTPFTICIVGTSLFILYNHLVNPH
nr:MAG TPA: hypothetical protein [Caudoviricetes sp.]